MLASSLGAPMQATDNGLGPSARRKRPMVSCRECHRRKEKCNRRQPCNRCLRRGKRSACVYELDQMRLPAVFDQEPTDPITHSQPRSSQTTRSQGNDETGHLGYANDANGTAGIMRSLGETSHPSNASQARNGSVANQYSSTIRELPSQRHIDFLVQAFFQNVAWHYDIVNEATLTAQLSQWSSLSHKQLKLAPDGLPTSLQAFPALLFQVLAQALLFQPQRHDKCLNDLKYAADMELSDRAAEYSDAGHRLASSFGKSDLTLTIVQAELMRACFEKTTGAVTEAWHTLGTAIRNAQELGLHKLEPEQSSSWRSETSQREAGRQVWMILHLWDSHMAMVLGRPMSTRMKPDDVPPPAPWSCSFDAPRRPSPRDVILCGYHTAYKYLQDIHDLEKIDDCLPVVQRINERLLTNIAELPSWAQAQRSRACEPAWLTAALEVMYTNIYFVLFALHRPFIFAESNCRAMAYYAAMQILESQARLFDNSEPLQHKAFSWVFSTFDAVVLIIALQMRFPEELMDQFTTTHMNLDSALERLKIISGTNELAASAFQVIKRLYEKMMADRNPPIQALRLESATSDSFSGMESEVLGDGWNNDALLSNLESYSLPPEPFNDLLCNASFGSDPMLPIEPSYGLHQPHSGVLDGL